MVVVCDSLPRGKYLGIAGVSRFVYTSFMSLEEMVAGRPVS